MKVECNICKIRWKLSATKTTSGKTEYLQPSMVHLVVEEKGWGGEGERDKNKTTLEEERRKGATAISAFLTKHKQRSGNISDKQDTHTNAKASDNVKENGNVIHELDLDLSNSVGTFYKDEGFEGRGWKRTLSDKFDSPSKRLKNFSNLLLYWGGSDGVVPNNNKTEPSKTYDMVNEHHPASWTYNG